MKKAKLSLVECFKEVEDPRVIGRTSHKLIDILVITVLAVICGCETWTEIADYGNAKKDWLKELLNLENGIPSEDTFNRVFQHLDVKEWEDAFRNWVSGMVNLGMGSIVSLDGKSLRGSKDSRLGKKAIHMVSAWASESQLVLGQLATEEKSNEITAIPELIKTLELKGCIITIDAMGCQTEIAREIVDAEADYFLAVKKNQKNLYESVEWLFKYADKEEDLETAFEDFEAKHGRYDTRRCWVLAYDGSLDKTNWKKLRHVIKVQRESENPCTGKTSKDTRYYISSLESCSPEKGLYISRKHWGIENHLHWRLDVCFKEDANRTRTGYAAQNLSLVRRIALISLKNINLGKKLSIKRKQFRALMDNSFAWHTFSQF